MPYWLCCSLCRCPNRSSASIVAWQLMIVEVGPHVAKNASCADVASRRLQRAMRSFQDQHMVHLRSGLVDACHHRHQEHGADLLGVDVRLGAEIGRQEPRKARLPI